jgi:pimeloyl-ACP methyl ester carboxylesterase
VVACHVAATASERVSALVLLDSGHLDYGDQPGVDPDMTLESWIENARARQWRWPPREIFLAEVREDVKRLTPEYEQAVLAGMTVEPDGSLRSAPPEVRGAVYRAVSRTRSSEAWPAIAGAGIPTLLLLATEPEDRAAENESGADRLRAAIPGATVVAVPGAGHDLIADAGPEVAALIADWLDANAPG